MHKTVKDAIGKADELAKWRSGEEMIPAPCIDNAVTIYERNPDGTIAKEGVMSISRPQDFATNPHMKYAVYGILHSYEQDGHEYVITALVHMYWDGDRDEDSARELVIQSKMAVAKGQWQPTAPSDPLMMDDFWVEDEDHPAGMWEDYDGEPLFNNFTREPLKKVGM